jgi:hypothetical protein
MLEEENDMKYVQEEDEDPGKGDERVDRGGGKDAGIEEALRS